MNALWTRRLVRGGAGLVALLLAYLLLYPAPVDPLAYEPPAAAASTGALQVNSRLRDGCARIADGRLQGPEDVAVDGRGRIYGGLVDGRIMRTAAATPGAALERFADTGGRPLGLDFDAAGNLIVADAVKGLLSVDRQGTVRTLSTQVDGVAFGFTDDVDVAPDGRIYFSDASTKFGAKQYLFDMLESRPHGRLLRYDPKTGRTELLLAGLYFANGVAVAPNGDFVLVVETYRYRVQRYWLRGPRSGKAELFADGLPGFPDGISTGTKGRFWMAIYTLRNADADWLSPRPNVKRLLSKLPRFMWPKPKPYGLVLGLDAGGRIIESRHDVGGRRIANVTSVEEHRGNLYLGGLHSPYMARCPL